MYLYTYIYIYVYKSREKKIYNQFIYVKILFYVN